MVMGVAIAGCNNPTDSPDVPPAITIIADNTSISWMVGLNKWNGATIDHIADFPNIMSHTTFYDLPYIKNGESITIHFDYNVPETTILTEFILKEDGNKKYNVPGMEYVISFLKNNTVAFIIEPNFSTAFSSFSGDYEPGNTIKGYRMVCTWGGNECEYVFIIRGDAAITMMNDEPDN